jgi:hypothetical protein
MRSKDAELKKNQYQHKKERGLPGCFLTCLALARRCGLLCAPCFIAAAGALVLFGPHKSGDIRFHTK